MSNEPNICKQCECGEYRCECGAHNPTMVCRACSVEDAWEMGLITEEARRAKQEVLAREDINQGACSQCSNGRSCNPICVDCEEQEGLDESEHQRAHSAAALSGRGGW